MPELRYFLLRGKNGLEIDSCTDDTPQHWPGFVRWMTDEDKLTFGPPEPYTTISEWLTALAKQSDEFWARRLAGAV